MILLMIWSCTCTYTAERRRPVVETRTPARETLHWAVCLFVYNAAFFCVQINKTLFRCVCREMPFFMNIRFVFTGDRKPNYGHFFMSSKSRLYSLFIREEDMQSISIAFYTETKIKTPFGGCWRSTRQQPVALRFRI